MVPVLVFFATAVLVGCLIRVIVGLAVAGLAHAVVTAD